jgi:diguanylate cyclase (GGDEF)-like protein
VKGKTLSILLVENNSTDADLIREILHEYDGQKFNLTQVQSVELAIAILATNSFDVMLLDLAFSEGESKSSLDTLDLVRQQVPQLPIIVLMPTECLDTELKVILQGAQNCLIKSELEAKTLNRSLQYAIARQRLRFDTYQLAILDGLTGIANRRYFDLVLNKEWQRLAREQQPLSLILCDIDYFKAYNDTYGHQQGDRCLQQVAQILQQSTRRPADLVARYGGEEFALILPNTDAPGALFLAHRIVRQLTQESIPHSQSQISKVVTLSIGIATKIPDRQHPCSTIIETTDNLLYKAKQAGRNQYALDNWLTSGDKLKIPYN